MFSQGESGLCSAKGKEACVQSKDISGLVFSQGAVLVHTCGCLMAGSCMCVENFHVKCEMMFIGKQIVPL